MIRLPYQTLPRPTFRLPRPRQVRRFQFWNLAVVLSVVAALPQGHAQETNAPLSQYTSPPVYSQALETNLPPVPMPVYVPEAAPAPPLGGTRQMYTPATVPLSTLPPLFRYGPLTLQTHALYRVSYGNGLRSMPGQKAKSVINELAPGFLAQWGSHWALDYTPTLRFYSSSAFRDTVDHSVTLSGGTTYEDWTLGFSQSYMSSSEPLIETSRQTDQQTLSTRLSADYQINSKTSLELELGQNLRLIERSSKGAALNNFNSWSASSWLNYKVSPGIKAAVGAGFEYIDCTSSSDITSEQIQGRITWAVSKKLEFVASGGVNNMQFLSSGASDLASPIFSLSVQYAPYETTTFFITAYQAVQPSYYQDQVTENTFINAGLHQRLLGKLYLDLSGGYGNSAYHASAATPVASHRDYDTTSFSASLSTPFLKRGFAAVFYSVNRNASGAADYDYTTTSVGLQLSYRY